MRFPWPGFLSMLPKRYLRKMIAAGHKVAICEQMEDPASG